MIARYSFLSLLLFFVACYSALYVVKYRVQAIKDDNDALQQQVQEEQMALHLLQAEWSYLNRKERLVGLAEKHLKMQAIEPQQVVSLQVLQAQDQHAAAQLNEAP